MECWSSLNEVYGQQTVTPKTVRSWYRKFNSGVESVKDVKRPGRPRTVRTQDNIQKVRNAVLRDRRSSVDSLANATSISRSSVHVIMKKDLTFCKLAPKFVPCLLTPEQKAFHVRLCEMNLQSLREDDTFLSRVVTGDETWISIFEIELKKDSHEWHAHGTHAARPIKAIRNRSCKKVMLTVFYDEQGLVTTDFLPPRQTVDSDYYCSVLRKLKEDLRRKRPELWAMEEDGWCAVKLHQDNAPPHVSAMSLAMIGSSALDMVPHPPYSPDLAPCDFFLFPRLKAALRGHRHQNLADLRIATMRALRNIDPADFRDSIQSLPVRWMKCIKAQGEYFEGRHLAIDPLGDHELELVCDSSEDET